MRRRLFLFLSVLSLALCIVLCLGWAFASRAHSTGLTRTISVYDIVEKIELRYERDGNFSSNLMHDLDYKSRISIGGLLWVDYHFLDLPGSPLGMRRIVLPYSWLVPLFAVMPGIFTVCKLRQRGRPNSGYCKCGYSLTGNTSGICPECGPEIAVKA